MKKIPFQSAAYMGETGRLAAAIEKNWLIGLRESNPAILDMFRDRDVQPYRDLLPWSGEFAGKYLTSTYYIYQITHSRELREYTRSFITELISLQAEDGYLGCYQRECRLTGAFSQNPAEQGRTWDGWAHYHIMYGLYLWYKETGEQEYFDTVKRIARLFMNSFYDGRPTLSSIGSSEMNLAVYHIFALLYQETREVEYLHFARKIEEDLASPEAGDYIRLALEDCAFYRCPKPRWESLHVIMGIGEMARATGEKRYLQATRQIVHSILETDVHNTGGFSTNEQAIGHPFANDNIETCCVVAFNALAAELFELTGEPALVDFLERAHFNAILGSFSPTGRWSTYNTPMDGVKCASYQSIVFQSRPGSPDLNCCSVNAPRGVGQISDWALMEEGRTLYLNHYEAFSAVTADGLALSVSGDYPCENRVEVRVSGGGRRRIGLRIPAWSADTLVEMEGETLRPKAGGYLFLERDWDDVTLTLRFDFTPRMEKGGMSYEGKSSLYVGPILYAWDNGRNPGFCFEELPTLSQEELAQARPVRSRDGSIHLSLPSGAVLVDFQHAGVSGSAYKTWLTLA